MTIFAREGYLNVTDIGRDQVLENKRFIKNDDFLRSWGSLLVSLSPKSYQRKQMLHGC